MKKFYLVWLIIFHFLIGGYGLWSVVYGLKNAESTLLWSLLVPTGLVLIQLILMRDRGSVFAKVLYSLELCLILGAVFGFITEFIPELVSFFLFTVLFAVNVTLGLSFIIEKRE